MADRDPRKEEVTVFVCGVKTCKHVWDGPQVEFENGATVTCSKCGEWAINVSMMEGM